MNKPVKAKPRGIRNCNPLNIKIGNTWLGEVDNPTDPVFEQFVSMKYGVRAAFIILRRYIRRYGHNTIASIISTWAPETENLLHAYIDNVVKFTGIMPNARIVYEDKETMCALVAAMIRVECGEPIDEKTIRDAYELA